MILALFIRWINGQKIENTQVLWYGAAIALLVDAFLISLLVYGLRAAGG